MMKTCWILIAIFNGHPEGQLTIFNIEDREACEMARSQILDKQMAKRAECIYVPFRHEDAIFPFPDHAPDRLPDHAPEVQAHQH